MKILHIINVNVVWGCLSENYLTRKFIAQNIFDTKYSRLTEPTADHSSAPDRQPSNERYAHCHNQCSRQGEDAVSTAHYQPPSWSKVTGLL